VAFCLYEPMNSCSDVQRLEHSVGGSARANPGPLFGEEAGEGLTVWGLGPSRAASLKPVDLARGPLIILELSLV